MIDFATWAPCSVVAILFIAACVELLRERRANAALNRGMALLVGVSGFLLALLWSLVQKGHHGSSSEKIFEFNPNAPKLLEQLPFEGAPFFALVSMGLFLAAVLLCPSVPVVRVRMSRVFALQGAVIALTFAPTLSLFLPCLVVILLLFISSVRFHATWAPEDERAAVRAGVFTLYQSVALALLVVSGVLHAWSHFGMGPVSNVLWWVDVGLLLAAGAIVVGLFPFHGWVIPFFGAPRSSIFLPLLCVEIGLLFFFRVMAPLVAAHAGLAAALLPFPVIGVVYAAVLFFGEQRLKRIPAYLYLSHVSLMALGTLALGNLGIAASMLDGVNVLLAVSGLMAVCALLTSRYGLRGVWVPTGLGVLFPELAVCYLLCVLTLVGFPGTLGFIEEELLLGHSIEHHKVLVGAVAVALTLNGFSSFRLFARIFYGQPFAPRDAEMGFIPREKLTMLVIVVLIILNGVAPEFLVRHLSALAG